MHSFWALGFSFQALLCLAQSWGRSSSVLRTSGRAGGATRAFLGLAGKESARPNQKNPKETETDSRSRNETYVSS